MANLKLLAFALLLFFLTAVSPVLAADLALSVAPLEQTVTPGTVAFYSVTLTNNQETEDNVSLSLAGPNLQWLQDGVYLLVTIPGRSSVSSTLKLYPVGEDYGNFPYTLAARSVLSESRTASVSFSIDVGYGGKLALPIFTASRQGESLQLTFKVATPVKAIIPITVKIKDEAGTVKGMFAVQEEVGYVKTFGKTVTLAKDLPVGVYTAEASLDGTDQVRTAAFSVEPRRSVTSEQTVVQGNWYDEVVITVTNNGNVPEEAYRLDYPVPADKLTGFVTKVEGCVAQGSEKTCSFILPPLAPGETANVVYRIEYWPSAAGFAAGGVILAMLAGLAVVSVTRPRITKSTIAKKAGVAHISLDVKSPRLREAKAVVVRDFVSPLAEVQYREFESLRPVIRKTEAGTELIWKIGDMKAKEHRILSYKIKPLVGGQVKMPRAYMKYSTSDEKRYKLFSGQLTV